MRSISSVISVAELPAFQSPAKAERQRYKRFITGSVTLRIVYDLQPVHIYRYKSCDLFGILADIGVVGVPVEQSCKGVLFGLLEYFKNIIYEQRYSDSRAENL